MIQVKTNPVSRQLEALWTSGSLTGMTDMQLLNRFASVRDATAEMAFRELMRRHGPMVMGVCRQLLRHPHDADDAFQATVLILVRKAGSIRLADSLAPWLYAVAYRTAHRARATASRYRSAPVEQFEDPVKQPVSSYDFDLRLLLHEELSRLPGKYREPIVLCHLEGKTHEEAASLLHWPVGTVSGRLSRGRDLLRSRLKRRGVDVAPTVLGANWLAGTPTSVALPLVDSVVVAAIGGVAPIISASVLTLTRGALNAMQLNKLKMVVPVVLLGGGIAAGAGILRAQVSHATPRAAPVVSQVRPDDLLDQKAPVRKPGANPRIDINTVGPGTPGGPGRAVAPVQMKNYPRLGPLRGLSAIRTASMVLVESADRRAWRAMSLEKLAPGSPGWDEVQVPPDTTAQPIAGSDVAALIIKGKRIERVAAFSPYSGHWVEQMLLHPVEEEITPVVGPRCALYQAGKHFYAFSASRSSWGVLSLEGDEEASAALFVEDIEVLQGNRLYVFNLNKGLWSKGVSVYLAPTPASPKK